LRALIRIYGPPSLEAIKTLEALALSTSEVCIMNSVLIHADPYTQAIDWLVNYFSGRGKVSYERCGKILTKAENLEGYDFVFEWFLEPTDEHISKLIGQIDNSLQPIGAHYTITIKK
jgi:hypothetical protein